MVTINQPYVSVSRSSRVRLFVTTGTVAHEAPPSMGFPRQEYWSGYPFPSPGDLPDPGIEPGSPTLQADSLPSEPPGISQRYTHAPSLPPPAPSHSSRLSEHRLWFPASHNEFPPALY